MAAKDAVEMLIDDHGDKNPMSGFRKDFAEDKPYKSFLQRVGMELDQVLEKFKWEIEDSKWTSEYGKEDKDMEKLAQYRRQLYFCICGWREMNEDFRRGDVSCLRDIRTPLVTSRSPLRAARDEFSG